MTTPSLKNTLLISLLASMLALAACEKAGPMEKAGKRLDNAVDDASDAIDEAADDIKEANN